jgi:hypothetical protein
MDAELVSAFAAVLTHPGAVITDETTLTESGRDYWGFGGQPGLLLRPRTRDEVVAIVQTAARANLIRVLGCLLGVIWIGARHRVKTSVRLRISDSRGLGRVTSSRSLYVRPVFATVASSCSILSAVARASSSNSRSRASGARCTSAISAIMSATSFSPALGFWSVIGCFPLLLQAGR